MTAGARQHRAFVALGSNLGDREAHLLAARRALDALPGTRVIAASGLFETEPVGGPEQGRYLNAVLEIRTRLGPEALLEALLLVEERRGRVREAERNAPRTLDLDLLLYADRRIETPALCVPHPRLTQRAFVLEPLAQLAPDLVPPGADRSIAELARRVRDPLRVRPFCPHDRGGSRWPSSR